MITNQRVTYGSIETGTVDFFSAVFVDFHTVFVGVLLVNVM